MNSLRRQLSQKRSFRAVTSGLITVLLGLAVGIAIFLAIDIISAG
jgi:hypothetical protein